MIRLLTDENLDQRILRGLYLRIPELDCLSAENASLRGLADPVLLDYAAAHNRILLSHDVHTMPRYAIERMNRGLLMPGVIIVPDSLEIGRAIADLEIIIRCCVAADLNNQIVYLPL